MNILEIKNLSINYQGKSAVNNVSFDIPSGKVVAIVGESGSGKSTLIRSIMGLLPQGGAISDGKILFDGKNIANASKEEMQKIRGEEIAMIFQSAGAYLNPRLKIGKQYIEMLRSHMSSLSKKDAYDVAIDMLKRMKLSEPENVMNSYAMQLSGGMQQRVAIAMALSLKPRILLADEPTSALDVTIQAQVVKELMDLCNEMKTTIVIVTHNMGVASVMSDYIAVMKHGELMEYGTRDQIINNPQNEYTKNLLKVVPRLEEKI